MRERHLYQNRHEKIERGIEQKQRAAKKHLDTREFKQQQEMLSKMKSQIEALHRLLSKLEEKLATKRTLREANPYNYKDVLKEARELIETFQAALAHKEAAKEERDKRIYQANNLLRDRDEAVIRTNKLAKLLEAEKAKSQELVQKADPGQSAF